MKTSWTPTRDSIQDIVDSRKPKYMVPRGLFSYISLFEAHFNTAGKMPIIVVGDTGVGKRLFLHLFEKLYKEKNNSSKVKKTNCAYFYPNLARSELFGYKKGAFTDAKEDTPGFIEKADGGALILDEIGELPLEVQGILLTFIETGKYHRVGDPTERSASVKIIAATNNLEKLGDAFRERFYIFYVPPLHQRRMDVLYYLWWLHPEVIQELMCWEVLALIAHNWPGNVREIDKIGRFLKRKAAYYRSSPSLIDRNKERIETKLLDLSEFKTSFNPYPTLSLHQDLKRKGVDVKTLEWLLNSDAVGLESKKFAFSRSAHFHQQYYPEHLERFDVLSVRIDYLDEAFIGYREFCTLFFQDLNGNQNNIIVKKCKATDGPYYHLGLDRVHIDKYKKLQGQILRYLSGIEIPSGREVPNDSESRETFCLDLLREYPSNAFLAPLKERYPVEEKKEQVDIWSMKYEEFLRYYYKGLIERTGGNKREAAKRIGVNYQTFNSRYRSLFKE